MTFIVSVAAGRDAADSLHARCETRVARGERCFTRHKDLAVAYTARAPWFDRHIDIYDDGDVLVVLDGRLHNLSGGPAHDQTGGPVRDQVHGPLQQAGRLRARYGEHGLNVASGLLGDFVLIVLDRSRDTLLVARDPIGVRPWYHATAADRHAGASDMATLASLPWVDTSLNEPNVIGYLAAVTESRGDTFYRGIGTLAPGHTWYTNDRRTRAFQHHRWDLQPDLDATWDDAAERCRSELDEAVRCRLDGTGMATSEVSGGLDSSSVVGTLARLGCHDLIVGRLVFETPNADERSYSDAVIAHWQIPAVSVPPWVPTEQESCDLLHRLKRPVPDPHFTMFTGLHRALVDRGRLGGLTGLGGDDAFATCGVGPRVLSAVKLRQGSVIKELAGRAIRHPRHSWVEFLRPTLHHMAPWKGDRLPPWVSDRAAKCADLARLFRRRAERVTGVDAIDERIANLTSGYDAAILEDRAVVIDGVGRRDSHPYLDPRFIEATYGLDPWWPTRGGHTRALQVEAFTDRLPPAVAERRSKADFSEVFWPQLLEANTLELARTGPLADLGWLDTEGFDALIAGATAKQPNAAIPLSRCVSLDRWLRIQ